ncbi:MAG TPA: dihydrodipicolinate synthase family protein [Anaerolineales bacterium]|nr:dihydrodipicolinate synthase family protein [Anaerolineales bacterium]
MQHHHILSGVYAAAVTPLDSHFTPTPEAYSGLLSFLAQRGCHGALLLGTTGEGPSFSAAERIKIFQAASQARHGLTGFRLLAGTGTPSLDETIAITRFAFDLGFDGVVVLPPYYFRKVSDDGLFEWFSQVLRRAVPSGGALLAYHIPPITGIGFSHDLLARLLETFPGRFVGVKDSSNDPQNARLLGERFGKDLLVLNGNDRLFSTALQAQASGCITAVANLRSPDLRQVWDSFQAGTPTQAAQARLDAVRTVLERYQPFPPIIKSLLAQEHDLPYWFVRPPLLPVPNHTLNAVLAELSAALQPLVV